MPLMIRCKAFGSRTPPRTPPSEPAKDTLKLPVLWQLPLSAESKKEPDREVMSNQPSYETAPPFYLSKSIAPGLNSLWRLPFLPSPPNYRNLKYMIE